MNFLLALRDDLRAGLAKTPPDFRARHARWIAAHEHPQGGFVNRRGNAELYYTAFALRSLSALDALAPELARRSAAFLAALPGKRPDPCAEAVSAASWWDALALCEEAGAPPLSEAARAEAAVRTRDGLAALRRDDGGWAKTPIEGNGSLYHTFLAACAFARMGQPVPDQARIQPFLDRLARPEGGFLENAYSKRPGTNGSAAGVALVGMLRLSSIAGRLAAWAGLQETLRPLVAQDLARHSAFLKTMQNEEGGFQATPGAPLADLLSTYTALFTLKLLDGLDPRMVERAAAYAGEREDPEGGYTGFALESVTDCEYAFYGLGVASIACS